MQCKNNRHEKMSSHGGSDFTIMTFLVEGVTPLLQNNPAQFIGNESGGGITAKKKVYDDKEEAEWRTYRDDEGRFGHPAEAFSKAMQKAATGRKIGKQFATTVVKGAIFPVEDLAIIEDANGDPVTDYVIDRRSVVVGKARVLRARPRFNKWRMRVALEVDEALLSYDQVAEILALAGKIKGIGDKRPEVGGRYGRFVVLDQE